MGYCKYCHEDTGGFNIKLGDKRTHKCVECKKETDIVKKKNIISPLIKVNCTGFVGKIEK